MTIPHKQRQQHGNDESRRHQDAGLSRRLNFPERGRHSTSPTSSLHNSFSNAMTGEPLTAPSPSLLQVHRSSGYSFQRNEATAATYEHSASSLIKILEETLAIPEEDAHLFPQAEASQ
eukprot:CAMPEP_0176003674 /NCGR_PEP_ID=MMETSP0120_2-20121206/1297_1 /TAXON_ID=160619 /ORGANISM="Kryptoperidinium foliaceum, Strain CCMP 1326" /LENGTH=117 /DNA_ID=CAMNT_0017336327 /DNA_START=87 /DNA_END=440 /DNA_ORIENTATION=+